MACLFDLTETHRIIMRRLLPIMVKETSGRCCDNAPSHEEPSISTVSEENVCGDDIMRSIYERQRRHQYASSKKRQFLNLWELLKKATKTKFAAWSRHHAEASVTSSKDEDNDDVVMTSMWMDANIDFIEIGDWLQRGNNVFDDIMERISKEEETVSPPHDAAPDTAILQPPQQQPHQQLCRRRSEKFRAAWRKLLTKKKNRKNRRYYKEPGDDADDGCNDDDGQATIIECIDIVDGLQKQKHSNVFDAIMVRICADECRDVSANEADDGNNGNDAKSTKETRISTAANSSDGENAEASSPSSQYLCQQSKLKRLGKTVGKFVKTMLLSCSRCSASTAAAESS